MLLRQKEQRETQVKPDKEAQFPVTLAAKTPDVMTDIVLLQKSTENLIYHCSRAMQLVQTR